MDFPRPLKRSAQRRLARGFGRRGGGRLLKCGACGSGVRVIRSRRARPASGHMPRRAREQRQL